MGDTTRERIIARRTAVGLSQRELERRASLPPTACHKIENGTRDVTADELAVIARVLRIPVDDLIGKKDPMSEDSLENTLLGIRKRCSPKQRQLLAEVLRSIADEFAPV